MEYLTMNDIAGYEKEKEELRTVINMFNAYRTYTDRGAYLSKGLILSGPPGVGKTLFAKVLASEIHAPFYHFDGAQNDSIRGVRKLRALFAKAHRHAPAVVFIDELNTFVGDYTYHSDYTHRNLSALLKLIDGLAATSGVLVVGASSDKDDLDDALLRSGRMDRHICLDTPDQATRAAILDYFIARSDLDYGAVDRKAVIAKTSGLNGADIKTLVNEVALSSIYRGTAPDDECFFEQICKIARKDIVREKVLENESMWAMHDLGHLLVSRELLHTYAPISVRYDVPNDGNSSILFLFDRFDNDWESEDDESDENDDRTRSDDPSEDPVPAFGSYTRRETLLDAIAVLLGGQAIEAEMLGTCYDSSVDDLRAAQNVVESLFDNGLCGYRYVNLIHLDRCEISPEGLAAKERRRAEILTEQYERALAIVRRYADVIPRVHAALTRRKTLSRHEVEALLAGDSID